MSSLLRSCCRSWKTNCDRGNKKGRRKGKEGEKGQFVGFGLGGGEQIQGDGDETSGLEKYKRKKGQQQHTFSPPFFARPNRRGKMCVVCSFSVRPPAAPPVPYLPPIYGGGVNCYRTPPRRSVHQDRKMVGNKTSDHSRFISLRHLSRSIYGKAENRQENPTEICVFYPSPNGKTLSIFHSYSPLHHHIPLFFFISRWPASKTDRNIRQPAWQCRLSFYLKEIP